MQTQLMQKEALSEPKILYIDDERVVIDSPKFPYDREILSGKIGQMQPAVVVDVGSGKAEDMLYCADLYPDVTFVAIDIGYDEPENRRLLPSKENIHYIIADAKHLPIKDASSDITTSFCCSNTVLSSDIEGCKNVGYKALEEAKRATKCGGIGIFSGYKKETNAMPYGPHRTEDVFSFFGLNVSDVVDNSGRSVSETGNDIHAYVWVNT